MPITKAIYKPVVASGGASSDGGGEQSSVVFDFEHDDDDDPDHHQHGGTGGSRSSLPSSSPSTEWSDEGGNVLSVEDSFYDEDSGNINAINSSNNPRNMSKVQPMEISTSSFDEDFSSQLFDWKDPWLPTVLLMLLLIVPVQVALTSLFYNLLGVWFVATPLAAHMLFVLGTARHLVGAPPATLQGRASRAGTSAAACVDNVTLGIVYPAAARVLIRELLTDLDGTVVVEWSRAARRLRYGTGLGLAATVLRCGIGLQAAGLRAAVTAMDSEFTSDPTWVDRWCHLSTSTLAPFLYLDSRLQLWFDGCMTVGGTARRKQIRRRLGWFINAGMVAALGLLTVCLHSAVHHFGPRHQKPPPQFAATKNSENCDPLDETECWLPFPSFHAMVPDNATVTGWRVNLEGRLLPPLKRARVQQIQPDFLNQLDGFSTMAPMMFYLDGLKEAHEAGLAQLKGADDIAESVTGQCATLLLDVETAALVPHSAEIDYLDEARPLVLLFPAEPLHHNRHYAVAVVGAKDARGERLPPTRGMVELLRSSNETTTTTTTTTTNKYDPNRRQRYTDVLIPALERAAPWLDRAQDPGALQLLFDFHTISAASQLGPVRAVRDATLEQLAADDWQWAAHVRTVRQVNYDCRRSGESLARTVHAELDVPWFLQHYGPGGRSAFLDEAAVRTKTPVTFGSAKFLVHIPCSLQKAALRVGKGSKPLRAVMEYGHGLFGHRGESSDSFITKLAHDEGYIVLAMDWRGMSNFDLLNVIKVLIAEPRLFQSVRDNLIQGYACKYAMQHFARYGLLSMDWLKFKRFDPLTGQPLPGELVPTYRGRPPAYVFYGISQGGILGAGYTALSGVTGLIDRAVLGSPGTPFALIMTRSLDFLVYDTLLMFDFYSNRHVRMLLSLVQMAWDSVEASGVLARPVTEPYPPTLIQTGLGDVIVPTIAAEALARAFNATAVPANPREIFGIPVAVDGEEDSRATLTELMYDKEYLGLSADNTVAEGNAIHVCLRRDKAMISQIAQFLNTGTVIDPCAKDGCHRNRIQC